MHIIALDAHQSYPREKIKNTTPWRGGFWSNSGTLGEKHHSMGLKDIVCS
jgi:hypothetical protein